jgi:FixJ family two-component response regulator
MRVPLDPGPTQPPALAHRETMNRTDATIFIVDDDPSVRKSLLRLVRSAGWQAETFASAREFLARAAFSRTGCVILDVRMPGMTGPELRDLMDEQAISLPVIFLTGHGDVPTGVDAMKKGAVDFLQKPVDDEALLQAIHRAVEWHAAAKVRRQELERIQARLQRLTPRERQVLEYVIGGCLNKQIAAELGIAEKTVKVHRGFVMDKMEVTSVADLVRQCETAGIAPRLTAAG